MFISKDLTIYIYILTHKVTLIKQTEPKLKVFLHKNVTKKIQL
jgi:hypothetical protein